MFTTAGDQIFQFPPAPFPSNDRRWKPTVEHAPNCPRCASANTKFCYYNNYSLSQPRYFCKGCRRYWTKGGSLRNVPVGGGCRKNRRGRAARLACQQHARSYLHNSDPGSTKDSLSHLQSGGSEPKSDIDLAVVFANFLNPNTNTTNSSDQSPESELPNEGNGSIQLSNCSSHDMMYPVDQEVEFLQEFPDLSRVVAGEKQSRNPELMNMEGHDDMNALYYNQHIPSLLGDELVQDVLWSSPDQDQPDPNWQPMMQLQDLDLLQSGSDGGDCSKLNSTMNLTGDNWSSFDFSAFEVFPRP